MMSAVGTPAITTRHAGNPEALPPLPEMGLSSMEGFVVDERDPEGLAGAMRRMMNLSAEQRTALQIVGRKWIEQRFDLQRTVEQYDALYQRLTQKL